MGKKTIGRFVLDSDAPITVGTEKNIIFTDATISTQSIEYDAETGEIKIKTPGVYMIHTNFTVLAVCDNYAEIRLLENGIEVPGAKASAELSEVGGAENLTLTAVTTVRPSGQNEYATLTFKNLFDVNYTIANVIVEKVA